MSRWYRVRVRVVAQAPKVGDRAQFTRSMDRLLGDRSRFTLIHILTFGNQWKRL